jgi:hypothetical protein
MEKSHYGPDVSHQDLELNIPIGTPSSQAMTSKVHEPKSVQDVSQNWEKQVLRSDGRDGRRDAYLQEGIKGYGKDTGTSESKNPTTESTSDSTRAI